MGHLELWVCAPLFVREYMPYMMFFSFCFNTIGTGTHTHAFRWASVFLSFSSIPYSFHFVLGLELTPMPFAGCFSVFFFRFSSVRFSFYFVLGLEHTFLCLSRDASVCPFYAFSRLVFRFPFSPWLFSVRSTVSDTQWYAVTGSLLSVFIPCLLCSV